METARLLTEGYDGEILAAENSWPQIYSAFQNKTILQVEAKGARLHEVSEKEIPCLQVQIGNIMGIVPTNEIGLDDFPQSAEELGELSNNDKRAILSDIERKLVGLPVWILILAVDRKNETFVASRERALEIMSRTAWQHIEEGAVVPGTIRELYRKVAILDLGGVEAVMYAHEMSWGWVDDAREEFERGKTYKVKVINIDQEKGEVEVSVKQTLPCPWPDCAKRYVPGGIYSGTVTGMIEQGYFVTLEPGVSMLVQHPKFTRVKKGDKVKVRIHNVNMDKQNIYGSFRE